MATKVASKFGMQVSGTATSAGTHGHPCHPKNWQHRLGVGRVWKNGDLLCNGTLESHPSTGRRKQQLFGLEWRYIFFTTMTLNCRHCRCVSVQAVFRWPSQKPFNNSLVGDWDTLVGCRSGEKCSASLRLDGNAVDPVDWTKESVGSVKRGQNKTLVWCLSACVSVYVNSVCVCVCNIEIWYIYIYVYMYICIYIYM